MFLCDIWLYHWVVVYHFDNSPWMTVLISIYENHFFKPGKRF